MLVTRRSSLQNPKTEIRVSRVDFCPKGRIVLILHLRGCLFLLFRSTLVVKIQKTSKNPLRAFSVMPKKNNEDKENSFHRQQFASPLLVSVAPGGLPWWGCFCIFSPHCAEKSRAPHYIIHNANTRVRTRAHTHNATRVRTRTKQPTACTFTYQEAGTPRWCRVLLSASSRLYRERASERAREGGGRVGERERERERERARARAREREREREISYMFT